MKSLRRRLLVLAIVGTIAAAFQVSTASAAGSGFFVGADEDALLWGNSQQTATIARTLGLRSIRITLQWKPGQSQVPAAYQTALKRLVLDSYGIRVVVSVFGAAADAPRTPDARNQYCSFVADLLRDNPEIDDVAIWNDPNDGGFWATQFGPSGASVAPADYVALLAQCYDQAHAVRKNANVISVAVSKSSDTPGAFTLNWHPPAQWFAKVAAAYKALRRTAPIFDTLGYIPHPTSSAERPWTKHPGSPAISLGDYPTLISTLTAAFKGTAQPVPGQGSTKIWYLAQGYQSTVDAGRTGFTGTETDPSPVPSWSPEEAADQGAGPGVDQAVQLQDAIRVAYCQPAVGAFFNFHLYDERDLAGWQSGVFWPGGQPKAAYQGLKNVAASVNTGTVNCAGFANGIPPRPLAVAQPAKEILRIDNLRATNVAAFGATINWKTNVASTTQVSYGLVDFGVPTVWTSAADAGDGQVASLIALDSSSAYRVWVRSTSEDGQTASATIDIRTPGIPTNPKTAIGRPAGAVMLDGMPYFPMMLYSVCPDEYAQALASGINLFALNACGTFQQQLNALGGRAFSTAIGGGRSGSGPGVIGWFHRDEPDGDNFPVQSLPGPPPGVPSLSFLTLTNHFYSWAAPLPWTNAPGYYERFVAKADVIGFDLYPLQEWCMPNRVADVFLAQRELVKLAGEKPTFQWIEADDWKCPGGATHVTPAVVRAESWLAIAGGAHGLGYWPARWDPGMNRVIAGVGRDVARLGPSIYMPSIAGSDGSSQIQMSARTYAGATYIFAINSSWSDATGSFTIPSLNGRPLSVMNESRRVNSDGDVFTDHFEPMQVHIYIAAPAGS